MLSENLVALGFTPVEAKIYLVLLEHGSLMAGELSKKTQTNRRTTYDTIERLIEKGYISYIISANRKVFNAVSPEIILDKIKETEEEAKKAVPALKELFLSKKEEQEANIYKGRKGIRTILNDMLKVKEYVGFGSNEKFPEIMTHDFDIFQKKKKELGIKSKTLMNESMRNKPTLKAAFTQYKFIKEKTSQPTSTFIYGNKVAIIIWSEVPVGTVIENRELAQTYLQYFDSLWQTARP
jgi:sugar-specific transcriptional regulator TrmB